jgi:hypothetical protein
MKCLSEWPRGLCYELSSNTEFVGSNAPPSMDSHGCLFRVFVVLCMSSGLATC